MVEQLHDRLGCTPVPIQMTIGSEEDFKGVVDLIKRKAIIWNEADMGMTFEYDEVPAELAAQVEVMREFMVEAAAEADDELMDKLSRGGRPQRREIKRGLRARTLANEILFPFWVAPPLRTKVSKPCWTPLSITCRRPSK